MRNTCNVHTQQSDNPHFMRTAKAKKFPQARNRANFPPSQIFKKIFSCSMQHFVPPKIVQRKVTINFPPSENTIWLRPWVPPHLVAALGAPTSGCGPGCDSTSSIRCRRPAACGCPAPGTSFRIVAQAMRRAPSSQRRLRKYAAWRQQLLQPGRFVGRYDVSE